jgi:RimJ/RimL family protein N-acetyltransferase
MGRRSAMSLERGELGSSREPEARLLRQEDVAELESWFADVSTTRWLGDRDYPSRLLQLAAENGRWAFVILDADDMVALVDVERDDDDPSSAAVAVAVAPFKRGAGLGRRPFSVVGVRPELAALSELVGDVEAGNKAAERCVVAAGFQPEGSASDSAFTRYVLRLG